jgi:hypothetical protein
LKKTVKVTKQDLTAEFEADTDERMHEMIENAPLQRDRTICRTVAEGFQKIVKDKGVWKRGCGER